MPTTVTNTIGASGADYTTVALWEDGTDNTSLVTADEVRVGACKNEVFSVAGNVATIAGATTDSTRYRHLTTDTGASFRDNANVQTNALRYNESNGAAVKSTSTYTTALILDENYARCSKLQIANTSSNGTGVHVGSGGAKTGVIVDGCIVEGSATQAFLLTSTSGVLKNSLIVQRASSRTRILGTGSGTTQDVINCTIVCPSDLTAATDAVGGTYSSTTFKNCAFFGASNVASQGTNTFTTCYCDDATPPSGCTQITYSTSAGTYFQNITDATRDYRIKTDSTLKDNGTTDATHGTPDIAGTARPSGSAYDVGCWEFVVAAGAAGKPDHYYRMLRG